MKEIIIKTFNREQTTQNYSKITFKKPYNVKKKKKELAVFEPKPPIRGFQKADAIPLSQTASFNIVFIVLFKEQSRICGLSIFSTQE